MFILPVANMQPHELVSIDHYQQDPLIHDCLIKIPQRVHNHLQQLYVTIKYPQAINDKTFLIRYKVTHKIDRKFLIYRCRTLTIWLL